MGKSSGSSTTVQKSDPWAGVQPYLSGQTETDPTTGESKITVPGIYNEAQRLYQSQGWTPEMQNLLNQQIQDISGRSGQVQQAYNIGNNVLSGMYDPKVTPVGNINTATSGNVTPVANAAGVGNISAQNVNAQTIDPTKALSSLGAVNPTQSIQQMLTGQANTATLDPVVNNAMTRLSQNFNEHVMPGLRNEAVASGQYGSSRQGIAEGLAARGLSQSMSDMSSNMYNNAYNTAQSLMGTTANNMVGLGLNAAQINANNNLQAGLANASNSLAAQSANAANQLSTNQFNANLGLQNNAQALQNNQYNANALNTTNHFNANLGLQNNTQAIQLAQQQLANQAQGLSMLGQGNQLQDQNYSQLMDTLNYPNRYNWNNLNAYSSIVSPGAGIGGTSTSSQPTTSNPFANALGGAAAGAAVIPGLTAAMGLGAAGAGLSTGAGAGIGTLLGLLSDRRYKRDIEKVGRLDNGLAVYRYRYDENSPVMLGVMADEVKAVKPEAVDTIDGVDYVNYGRL